MATLTTHRPSILERFRERREARRRTEDYWRTVRDDATQRLDELDRLTAAAFGARRVRGGDQ